ncbi:acetyl/propionyl-CoA carboxylase subuit alpha [Tistrella bauzanensis]|uniref:propionyl-CoA carboxylase n=1 Tax=Tistrella bauzanensis TaxID=657419 RepID=A0ABQ1IHR3_9PROT|nr:acetyl/propionyl/methylcrotonyl-CoA carboxylase subunit alpha [Tistrella bauzanensis]GGB41289.1 acetyl/propionyl-CoA carboxylase subuit alpha [Tistrella bauzanensis]
MFEKILIANRGEIACRVIRTARRMGIKTVAVYSDADADALHVRMADEAVHIGASPSNQSYLIAERIIAACKDTGAQAVHPGYGFLSENQSFAKALDAAGIAFIGPNIEAIYAMGDKIESKKLAKKAGVSTVPGYVGEIKDADEAVKIADEIGYPVMIKASAGGGGKGMRLAHDAREAREGFRSATSEAKSSFGDDRVFIEKFIEQPRHIEIQIIADGHGNICYLGERECSIQRRHQKVIEEAPSPFLDEATRKAMGEQAVALSRAVNYRSAGTVEFIVGPDRSFYFLEMNTRLQVEHPVTELITGLDLVELMIRVAAGEHLPFTQDEVTLTGWAMEARVYAEDPYRGFLPSIGRLARYIEPTGTGVRVDSGVYEGAEISMFYDPMVAKLVTYGDDRLQAAERMSDALDAYYIRGITHNIPFLTALIKHPRFLEGRLSTGFIAEEYPEGFHGAPLDAEARRALAAIAVMADLADRARQGNITGQMRGYVHHVPDELVVMLDDERVEVKVVQHAPALVLDMGGKPVTLDCTWRLGDRLLTATVDDRTRVVQIERASSGWRLTHGGSALLARVYTRRGAEYAAMMPVKQAPDMSRFLLSPMPGLVLSVAVEVGQEVKAGEELAVIEAMKMENVLRAERDCTVKEIKAGAGSSVAADQVIIEFE